MKKHFLFFVMLFFTGAFVHALENDAPFNADFKADSEVICAGGTVNFADLSAENPVGWSWTFEGGVPETSTQQNPSVVYNTPGIYKVSLKSNNGEEGDQEDKFEYIKVVPPATGNFTSSGSFCGGFNSVNFFSTDGVTHSWTFAGGSPATSTQANPSNVVFTGTGSHTVTHTVFQDGCTITHTGSIVIFPAIASSPITATASNCSSSTGTITFGNPTGGTPPFTHSVDGSPFSSNTFYNNLAPGSHTVSTKDANGCTFTFTATVGSTGPTAMTVGTTNATCGNANGQASVTAVTGGVQPYTYSADGGTFGSNSLLTGLTPGAHTITVKDANNCTFTKNIFVGNTAGPTAVSMSSTAAGCTVANGSVTFGTVTGGVNPFSYSLDGGTFVVGNVFTGIASGSHTAAVKDANGCVFNTTVNVGTAAGPTAVATTVTPSSCNASTGSVTFGTVTGGVGPYQFAFLGNPFSSIATYSNIAPGVYAASVKDANGCIFNTNVTVNGSQATEAVLTTTASSCSQNTGSITVTSITGGASPFSYSLNNGPLTSNPSFSNLAPGNYSVTIKDNNGCSFTKFATVTSNAPTAVAITTTNTPCGSNTGSVTLGAVTGGTNPFLFSFNGGAFSSTASFTNLSAGAYPVVVQDASGCTFTTTAVVNNTSGPSALVVTKTDATCGAANGTISIGATTGGTLPLTYSINNGAFTGAISYNNLAAGIYSVSVKDASGCIFTTTTTILQKSGPTDFAVTTTKALCTNPVGTISIGAISGGTSPFTYSIGGAFVTNPVFTGLVSDTYIVTVKDANNCTFSKNVLVQHTLPPSSLVINVTPAGCINASDGQISVAGVSGAIPFTYAIDGGIFTSSINFLGLTGGTHVVSVKDGNGCVTSQNVVVPSVPQGPTSFFTTRVNPTCGLSDGSITVYSVAGGTSPYTYAIGASPFQSSNTFTGLPASSYSIKVKDANGCQLTQTLNPVLSSTNGPTAISQTVTASSCMQPNGAITITGVTGGTVPYLYSVNGSPFAGSSLIGGQTSGAKSLTVKDANGCTFTKTVFIGNVGTPPATPTITQNVFTLTSSSSTGNQWFLNGSPISGATSQTYVVPVNGTYHVVVTNVSGCASAPSNSIVITNKMAQSGGTEWVDDLSLIDSQNDEEQTENSQPALVEEALPTQVALTVYPNPTDANVVVTFFIPEQMNCKIEIINSLGQVVFANDLQEFYGLFKEDVALGDLGNGIYAIVLTTPYGKTVQKIIVQ